MSARPQSVSETPAVGQDSIEFRLLGPLEIRRGGEAVAIGGRRARSLLALLLLHRGTVVSVDRIVDELWGETPPRTARHMVEVYVSKLRKTLGEGIIVTRPPGYRLDVDAEHVDAERFERLLAAGQDALAQGDTSLGAARLGDALGLWRGPPVADFDYEPFAQAEIVRLEELRLFAEEERVEAELALGRGPELVGVLEQLVARSPFRERFRGQLMIALYRAGRQAEALDAYREARKTFVEELGIEPSSHLRDLERAILTQEERLVEAATPERTVSPSSETRRTITLFIAEPSETESAPGLDPEVARSTIARSQEAVRKTVARYGGAFHRLPDGRVMGVFGSPVAHEDDAARALRTAVDLRRQGLAFRVGIDTGEALIERGAPVTGHLVRSATKLGEAGAQGEIVLGAATSRLVSHAAVLKPLEREPHDAWSLREIKPDAPARPLQLDVPLVGRDRELALLSKRFSACARESRARLVTLIGEPGIGKSRVAHEFAEALGEQARVLVGRCLAYGEGITYWPLKEALRQIQVENGAVLRAILARDEDAPAIADRIAAILGDVESVHRVEEIRWATRRLFEALARERPLVLVFEDLHWAEPTLLDLLRHIFETSRNAPILLLCLARTEFADERPEWRQLKGHANTFTLEALTAVEAEDLVSELDPSGALSPERRAQVIEAAEGNPLFLEQLVAFAIERGPGADLGVPPTLQALLAARLDRLGPGERAVMECAAVVGREFWASAVSEILPPEAQPTLRRHLEALSTREFIEPEPATLPFEDAFRFRHVLIQEAAYRSLPKARRAELHERLANSLENALGDVVTNEDEIIGHHLEQGYCYRAELAPIDESARALGERAADRLERAGRRAILRGDAAAAVSLLDRARMVLAPQPRRLRLTVSLCEALDSAGELERSYDLLGETMEEARREGDRRSEWFAALHRAYVGKKLAPQQWTKDTINETSEQARQAFGALGDHAGLARAWLFAAEVPFDECQFDTAALRFHRALEHARRSGDEREELLALNALQSSIYFGSTHVNVAREQIEMLRARTEGSAWHAVQVLCRLAGLQAMTGDAQESRELYLRARSIAQEMGLRHLLATATLYSEEVGLLFGDAEFAERELRNGYVQLEEMGEKGVRSTVAALLAESLHQLHRREESEQFADIALALASDYDIATRALGGAVKAKLLAEKQDFDTAERLACEAVGLAAETDNLFMYGRVLLAQAEGFRLGGRKEDSRPVLEVAVEVATRKGDVMTAGRARTMLAELETSA